MTDSSKTTRQAGSLFDADDNGHKHVSKIVIEDGDTITAETAYLDTSIQQKEQELQIPLSENALKVLQRRYLQKDESGNVIEEPVDMFRRVARFIASADALYDPNANLHKSEEKFFNLMTNLEFMPNSPTLMNAGRELGQLSACFVLPIDDSMLSIFEAVKNTALIHKSGGGTGFSFSRIRPQSDIVKSTRGVASGPISFLQVFDAATETVKQGGTRRGANMAILRVDHPDIVDFITCKEDCDHLNNFNISVAITEKFWDALESGGSYDLLNPHTNQTVDSLDAKEIFDKIVQHAWENGDPGVVFIDRVNADNRTPHLGDIESTNPCGEQPLLPFESCNLGSINLARMIKTTDGKTEIDYNKLMKTVRAAVHFLDNVIDVNKFPLEQIEEQTKTTRKIGLGVMGFADLLIHLDIPYNSEDAIDTAREVMRFINVEAKKKSQELAIKRGAFPSFSGSVYTQNHDPQLRNATCTTIAPTGTISIISNCSSGIEPLFALSFTRHVMDDDKLPEIHPLFCQRLKDDELYSEELIQKISETGSVQNMIEIPEHLRKVFLTSHDIEPEWHVRMQAAFQEFTDNAVSKTVNFSNDATEENVANVYRLAHDLGCKGVTIYRDGSRSQQVLNKGIGQKGDAADHVIGRPRLLQGFTVKLNTGQGSLYVTINTDESYQPVEIFANIGKSGGDTSALSEAIGRLISIALQKGVSVEELSHTLIGITGSRPIWNEGKLVKSVPDGIGQILLSEFGKNTENQNLNTSKPSADTETSQLDIPLFGPECPECGSTMETGGGCSFCRVCGYSHCG